LFKIGDSEIPWIAPPGVPVTITANGDKLLTGFVFLYAPSASPEQHQVRIAGRGKGADYIDSSVFHDTGVFEDKTSKQIIDEIVKPFGVNAEMLGSEGAQIPYYQVRRGSSAHREIIRLIQERGLIIGEDGDGKALVRARDAPLLNHEGG